MIQYLHPHGWDSPVASCAHASRVEQRKANKRDGGCNCQRTNKPHEQTNNTGKSHQHLEQGAHHDGTLDLLRKQKNKWHFFFYHKYQLLVGYWLISNYLSNAALTLTTRMRLCQTSMNSGDEVLTRVAFCVQAGQTQSGMDSKDVVGARRLNVPPWRIGNLSWQESSTKKYPLLSLLSSCTLLTRT